MSFHSPQSFYWLLVLVPLIVLWHFLKLRRKDHLVSSIAFWYQIPEDVRANVPFRWLRRFVPLLLQVGIVSLCVAALARPITQSTSNISYCLILQNSASMQAHLASGQTRWSKAKSLVNQWLDSLPPTTQIDWIDASHSPHLYLSETPFQVRQRLSLLTVQDTPAELDRAFGLAETIGKPVLLFADHLPTSAAQFPKRLTYHQVSGAATNYAITDAYLTEGSSMFVRVANLSPKGADAAEVPVQLFVNDTLYESTTLELDSGEMKVVSVGLPDISQPTRMRVVLGVPDALALDNAVDFISSVPIRQQLDVVAEHMDPYLESLLDTVPSVDFSFIPAEAYDRSQRITILHRLPLPEHLPRSFIYVPPLKQPNVAATILQGQSTHPILRGVDLDFWIGRKVLLGVAPEPAESAQPILESDLGPLIWVQEQSAGRSVIFGWDLVDPKASEFARSYAGWLLLANAIQWLSVPPSPVGPVPTGESVVLRPPPGTSVAAVQKPDGTEVRLPLGTPEIVFDETEQVGVYVFSAEDWDTEFTVGLLNQHESDLNPMNVPLATPLESGPATTSPRALWHWFVLAAIGLLCIEWWVLHRGE